MKNTFLICLTTILLFYTNVQNCTAQSFELDKVTDITLVTTNLALEITNTIVSNTRIQRKWDDKILDKSSINALDRFFMNPYDDNLNLASNIAVATATSLPFILTGITVYNTTHSTQELLTDALICAQTMAMTHSVGHFVKNSFSRRRPYMYYDSLGPDNKIYNSEEWTISFFSAHTAMAFASATCTSYIFWQYDTEPLHRTLYTTAAYSVAATVGALRVASGNHFFTDAITGAVTGTLIGYLIPSIHKATYTPSFTITPVPDGVMFKKFF